MDLKTLHSFLERRLGRPVELRLNENLHNLVSVVRPRGRPARMSVHRIFLDAPREVHVALVDFIRGPTPHSRGVIRRFICENPVKDPPPATRRTPAETQPAGRHFDLRRVADQINRAYFGGRLQFDITWSRRPTQPPRFLHNIQLGNWNERLRLVRIHPILDSPLVPKYYLSYIVYHEMAHIVIPAEVDDRGRVCHHTKRFYALERKFADYDRAVKWQARRLDDLVKYYCTRPRRRIFRQLTLF